MMQNTRVERSGGWAGIAFIVVTVVAAFLPGIPPTPDASPAEVGRYVDGAHVQWMTAAWLIFPGMAFYFWWLVQLRAYLRQAAPADDGLPGYLYAAGIVTGIFAMLVALDQVILGFQPSAALDGPVITVLWDVFNGVGTLVFVPATVMAFAASNSGRRHGTLPRLLVLWGYLTAVGCGLSTFSLYFRSGPFAMGGIATFFAGLLPFTVWVIWASSVLIRVPREGENSH
jgi:hypothetical protein